MTSGANLPAVLDPLAIIAGEGVLPRLVAEECRRIGRPCTIVVFEGIELDWVREYPVIPAIFEKPGRLFRALKRENCAEVTMAGGMTRPKLSPLRFDIKGLRLAPRIIAGLKKGDNDTLAMVTSIFEAEGFKITGAHDLLEGLLIPAGIPTRAQPSVDDRADAARAEEIVTALGRLDVGQGAVVAQGLCLATESSPGTDRMLEFVAETGARYRPDPDGARGVLLKAPKQGQDWRVDLPAIGPRTMEMAAKAGLAGVVIQSGGVLVLGLEDTVAKADELGLFLWARDPS